jgi:hypothetical protein
LWREWGRGGSAYAVTTEPYHFGVARRHESQSVDDARRAIYIDFEGTAVDPPSLLGAAWVDGGEEFFIQYVLEEALTDQDGQ